MVIKSPNFLLHDISKDLMSKSDLELLLSISFYLDYLRLHCSQLLTYVPNVDCVKLCAMNQFSTNILCKSLRFY